MYEYRIEKCKLAVAEELMNKMGKYGWKVITTTLVEAAFHYNVIITFERSKQ